MSKQFKSFKELGYDEQFYNSEGVKHLDNNFVGVYGNETAYCDSVTGEIFIENIYDENGTKVEIKDLEI